MHYIDIETKEIESDTLGSTKQSPPRNSNAVGVKFKQVAFPREGRETPLTGMTIRASGGNYKKTGGTGGVLKLLNLKQAARF